MPTLHFVLRKKGSNYFFSNIKTRSENELFCDKSEGAKILMELIESGLITKTDALELLETLLRVTDIPYGPLNNRQQFESDLLSMLNIAKLKQGLKEFSEVEKETGLPKLKLCKNCGEHGQIIGSTFISKELYDKEDCFDAVDELIGRGSINRHDEKKIRTQIENSKLPAKDPDKLSPLN